MILELLRSSVRVSATARGFSSTSAKRPKPIRVKKSEARRIVPKTPKPSNALAEVPAQSNVPANPFVQSDSQAPQTFGGVMKESFLWGMGMAAAFSVVGILFSRMEESPATDKFEGSFVGSADGEDVGF
uniref:Mitochondrial import inner membrane translocase subunit Tim21 n=1 Tax=Peronospora matthiolae TaxID=2874970 RepID=A0AAV1TQ05_9STRA